MQIKDRERERCLGCRSKIYREREREGVSVCERDMFTGQREKERERCLGGRERKRERDRC